MVTATGDRTAARILHQTGQQHATAERNGTALTPSTNRTADIHQTEAAPSKKLHAFATRECVSEGVGEGSLNS
jgi:hypothetical protein